ncbi:SDR family NAD(P)-dependent oxidoreductase, partial [Bacillus sp. SIMBA_069]
MCDLAEMDQVKQVMDQVDRVFGKVDILVNNGGIQRRSPAADFSEADWDDVLDVNLKTVFILCQHAG